MPVKNRQAEGLTEPAAPMPTVEKWLRCVVVMPQAVHPCGRVDEKYVANISDFFEQCLT
jgi:hypothetical protein